MHRWQALFDDIPRIFDRIWMWPSIRSSIDICRFCTAVAGCPTVLVTTMSMGPLMLRRFAI